MRQILVVWTALFVSAAVESSRPSPTLALSGTNNSTLTIHPSGLIVPRVGDIVTVTCQVQPAMPAVYRLEWNVPPTAINDNPLARMNITRNHNVLTLSINGIQKGDSGIYICSATRPEHSLVSNVTIAVVPKKGTCGRGFFVCRTKECIASRFVCDGRADCPDASDEAISKCGADPCSDKIACDDGRCLNREMCCDATYDDQCQFDRLPLCCLQFLKSKLMVQQTAAATSHSDDMGFLQSTVYAFIGCVAAFAFVVSIVLVAVCRLHMKQAAMLSLASRSSTVSTGCHRRPIAAMNNTYCRTPRDHNHDNQQPLQSLSTSSSSYILQVQQLPSMNLMMDGNGNGSMHGLVGRVVEPPPYSEIADDSPSSCSDAPPPPYSANSALLLSSRSSEDEI